MSDKPSDFSHEDPGVPAAVELVRSLGIALALVGIVYGLTSALVFATVGG
jgi:hypothetical protein